MSRSEVRVKLSQSKSFIVERLVLWCMVLNSLQAGLGLYALGALGGVVCTAICAHSFGFFSFRVWDFS